MWPAEHLPLGDELADHLRNGGTLASFGRSLTAPTDGTEGLMTLAQMALALRPAPDPLAVPRALQEAATMKVWLNTRELAELVGRAPGTVRGWSDGHSPRPGFRLERKADRGVWWKVVTDGTR